MGWSWGTLRGRGMVRQHQRKPRSDGERALASPPFGEKTIGCLLVALQKKGCIRFNRDKIELSSCEDNRPFVCQCDEAREPPTGEFFQQKRKQLTVDMNFHLLIQWIAMCNLCTDCPFDPMWTRYGSKYYGISDVEMTYSEAGAYCAARGGKLASIHSEEGFYMVATAVGELEGMPKVHLLQIVTGRIPFNKKQWSNLIFLLKYNYGYSTAFIFFSNKKVVCYVQHLTSNWFLDYNVSHSWLWKERLHWPGQSHLHGVCLPVRLQRSCQECSWGSPSHKHLRGRECTGTRKQGKEIISQ